MRRLLPTAGGLVDAAMVLALGMLALFGFATTFDGSGYLLTSGIAMVVGILLAHLTTALRQPVVVLGAVTLIAYFAAGPPLVLPKEPWLSLETLRLLAAGAALSWKQLLTTVPPVDAGSPLLVIPYLLGLFIGAAGFGAAQRLARRSRPGTVMALARAGAPALVPMAALVVVLACGTSEPAAKMLDGVGFAVVSLAWISARLRRLRPPARTTTRPVRRAFLAAGVVGAAAVVAALGAPFLPGAQTPRTVLREYVVPPFDLSAYPSPLVGFRKYTKDANRLWDQELFTVTGLPEGASVRIATLDDYDGTVWGATDEASFRLISSHITTAPTGPITTVSVTIGAAYAAALDLNAWLPEAGTPSRVDFTGDRARELGASLHYNRKLSAGIVTARLREGDSYTLRTTLAGQTIPDDVQPFGRPALSESAQAMLASKVAAWTKDGGDLAARIKAVAAYLQNNGAYTNGGPGETQYLPGHGIGRLTGFLKERAPAGDDEQYAAFFALAANYLGVPARVVLGARPDATGVVRGKDVHAWVELHLAGGFWAAVSESEFMPDPSKRPNQQPPKNFENKDAAVVPPPNAGRLPTTPTDTSRVDPFPQKPRVKSPWEEILAIVLAVGIWAGPPLLAVAATVGAIRGLKRRRRRRRRGRGLPANRHVGAWQDLVDGVRDLAAVKKRLRTLPVGHGATRCEHAAALDGAWVLPRGTFAQLALRIDGIVYGEVDPTEQDARTFWTEVEALHRELGEGLNRWQRLRVALSLRSLRRAGPRRRRSAAPTQTLAIPVLAGGRTR